MSSFLCIDPRTNAILYRAETLPQATGFADAHDGPIRLCAEIVAKAVREVFYRVAIVDRETGAVIATSPADDLYDVVDRFHKLSIAIIPDHRYPSEEAV